jgi:hypothetical protein
MMQRYMQSEAFLVLLMEGVNVFYTVKYTLIRHLVDRSCILYS